MNNHLDRRLIFQRLLAVILLVGLCAGWTIQPVESSPAKQGYNSYILQGPAIEPVVRAVLQHGGRVTSRLELIQAVAAEVPSDAIPALLADEAVTAAFPDAKVIMTGRKGGVPASDYGDVVGADNVWEAGVVGSGVTVAVVDTGLGIHQGIIKDLDGKPFKRILAWKDFVDRKRAPHDPNGHGTHIAGIIANTQLGEDEEWNGVAPGVDLVAVRVLDEKGYGTYSRVIRGIEWVIKNKAAYNIQVMNLSLVALVQSPYWADPLNQAVMQAWAEGITVVVAAGNGGPEPMTVGVPGNNPYVITVGAFTDNYTPEDWNDDYITPFSAAGPTLDGFVKPDLVAPGAHMVAPIIPSSYLARSYRDNLLPGKYFSMAGTSQSAAVVSGVAALIASQNPGLSPAEIKYRLQATALPWVDLDTETALYSMWQQGAGRVNAPDAVLADIQGEANVGMDILADLEGTIHYEGYSYFDEITGEFRLRAPFDSWAGGYGAWAGGYGAWAGGYGAWAGGYGAWAGGYGAWAGGYGAWAGGYGAWAGGYGAWAGGYGAWAGGYGAWAGGYGAWAGGLPWYDTVYAGEEYVTNYLSGQSPQAATTVTSLSEWISEP